MKKLSINPNTRTLTFLITKNNENLPCTKAVLLGSCYDLTDTKNLNENNCAISVLQSSHVYLKTSLLGRSSEYKGIKICAEKDLSIIKQINVIMQTPYGTTCSFVYELEKEILEDESRVNKLLYTDLEFSLPVDSYTRIEIEFNEDLNQKVWVTTWIVKEVDPNNLLDNKSIVRVYSPDKITLSQRIKRLFKKLFKR